MSEYLDENDLNDTSFPTEKQYEKQYRLILEEYGIDMNYDSVVINGTTKTGDAIGGTIKASLAKNEPTVVDLKGRVVIMSIDKVGNTTEKQPEDLFNYSLQAANNQISALHKSADSNWASFVNLFRKKDKKSPFDSISKEFDKFNKLGPLTPDSDINEYITALEDLKAACTSYYSYKEPKTNPDKEPSSLEIARTKYVDKVSKFAGEKLKELDLIAKAHGTMAIYGQVSNDSVKFQEQLDKERANERGLNGLYDHGLYDHVTNDKFREAFTNRADDIFKDFDYSSNNVNSNLIYTRCSSGFVEMARIHMNKKNPDIDFEKLKKNHMLNLPIKGNDKQLAIDLIVAMEANTILYDEFKLANYSEFSNKAEAARLKKNHTEMVKTTFTHVNQNEFYGFVQDCKPIKDMLSNLTYNDLYTFVTDKNMADKMAMDIRRSGELNKKLIGAVYEKTGKTNDVQDEMTNGKEKVNERANDTPRVLTNNNNKKSMGGMGRS